MLKKMILTGVGLGLVGAFLFGTGSLSYVETAAGLVKEKVRGSIPLEFEIRRAESLIEDIVPELRACKRVVAEEEVAVQYLKDEIDGLAKAQGTNRQRIDVQRAALCRKETVYFFGGRRYTHAALESNLERTFDDFRNNESLLESKNRLFESRLASLEAAKMKLEKVRLEKGRLENQVQNLYAQLRQVEAMEAHSEQFTFDDSKLARAKGLLDRCKKSLDVAQRMIENDKSFAEGFVVIDPVESRDILEEVDRYFANDGASGEGDDSTRYAAVASSDSDL